MALISIILALVAERFLLQQERYQQDGWFHSYMGWLQRSSLGEWLHGGTVGVIGLLLPPLLATALVQLLLQDLWGGILEFLFATAILLYALGPKNLDRQIEEFIDAWDEDEESRAREIADDLIADQPSATEPELSRAIVSGILQQACYRIFSVLFWFMLLGPLGALLYRLSRMLYNGGAEEIDPDEEFLGSIQRLLDILDWLPARITAASFALAGNLQDAILGWRGSEQPAGADDVLLGSGRGALGLEHLWQEDESGESPPSVAEAALGLIWRALAFWVLLPTVVVFFYWLG
jgi:membrane protein required for beta-lactamase induction